MQPEQIAGAIVVVALVLLALTIFFQSLRWIYRLISWFLNLPHAIADERFLPKFLAASVALLFSSSLIAYLVEIAGAMLRVLPNAVDELFRSARTIGARCVDQCSIDVMQPFGAALAGLVNAFVSALHLDRFPVSSFLTFLVIYTILFYGQTRIARWRQRQIAAGATVAPTSPGSMQFGFFIIVAFAFYLSLSALLVLSLMQSAKAPEGFSQTELKSAIELEIPAEEFFSSRFAPLAPFPSELVKDFRLSAARRDAAHRLQAGAISLATDWDAAAKNTHRQLIDLENRAIENFTSQSAERLGGRPTIDHFDRMLAWFQQQRLEKERNLSDCVRAVNSWTRTAVELVENWRADPRPESPSGTRNSR